MVKKIITVLVIVAILVGLYKITSKNPKAETNNGVSADSADLVIYWGEGCPHCENVKEYIATTSADSKLKIRWKEVYNDKDNQTEMMATVKKCPEIDISQGVGVPLAYSTKEQKCFQGDTPIIDWIRTQTSQQ